MSRPRGMTDKRIENLQPAADGKRYDKPDGEIPNLFVRVGARQKTFVLRGRFDKAKRFTRRAIGVFGEMPLDEARKIASDWNALVKRGLDPKKEKERKEKEAELARRHTFASVMEDYIAELPFRENNRHVPQDIKQIRRDILDPLRNPWLEEPISEIRAFRVSRLVKDIRDRPAPALALNTFRRFKTFFNWMMDPDRRLAYGLDPDNCQSPIRDLKAEVLGLSQGARDRVLDNNELRAYWKAADEIPYPYGPFYKGLLLTGVRKSELAGMRWSEIDWAEALWTVPKERFKAGTEHLVPLSRPMIQMLQEIRGVQPTFHGDCVFSTTNGQLPISGPGKQTDAFRARTAAALAEIQPGAVMRPWVLHDDRRVVRSKLGELGVAEVVAETVIGHGKKGMARIYDQYRYLPETRAALVLWADWLARLTAGSAQRRQARAGTSAVEPGPRAQRRRR